MGFASDVRKFCKEEAPEYIDTVIRRTVIEAGRRVIMRSPVGNPDLWVAKMGGQYVDYVFARGWPEGYSGGRFRGNWQYGFNFSPAGTTEDKDESGSKTLNAIRIATGTVGGAGIHYIVNNLPYAQRLEDGWSTQAPLGIIGLTEIELPQIFREAQR